MAVAAAAVAAGSRLGAQASENRTGGLTSGDYIRVSGGVVSPINAAGSLKDWKAGPGISAGYEGWGFGDQGVGFESGGPMGTVGFGLNVSYALLPLNEAQFVRDFTPLSGGTTTGASASRAGVFELASSLRFRIPAPYVMPTINVGAGFINWSPATVHYTSTTGNGDAKYAHRTGADLSIGAGLQRQIYQRYSIYVEASYVFGYTAYGQFAGGGGTLCTGCDPLKNTTVTTVRGGLAYHLP